MVTAVPVLHHRCRVLFIPLVVVQVEVPAVQASPEATAVAHTAVASL